MLFLDLEDKGQVGYKSRIFIATEPSVKVSAFSDPVIWASFWPETWQQIACGYMTAAEVIQEAERNIS